MPRTLLGGARLTSGPAFGPGCFIALESRNNWGPSKKGLWQVDVWKPVLWLCLINSVPPVHLSGKWIVTHSGHALPAVLPEALIALHIKLFISTSRGLRPHLGSNYKAARGTGVCHASQAVIYRFCLYVESELSSHLFPSFSASWLKASVSPNSLRYYLCGICWAAVKNQILWV